MGHVTQIVKNETNNFGDQIVELVFFDDITGDKIGRHYFMNPEGAHMTLLAMIKEAEQTLLNLKKRDSQ